MLRFRSSLMAFLTFAAVLPCCSSNDNPLLTDIASQYGEAYCIKLEDCMGTSDFNSAYPGGQEDCAARTFSIHGTSERSICTQEEWDTCTKDLEESTCTVSDAGAARPTIPKSCEGC